ncbi:hypothetical protein JMUB6875_66900 [Nocardia sp. JMUB6875]|uniref:hypothetical protein n=1 Tax=Nocardia sp. JMUB6875 TaxID=3158170 RepID=UPI0032E5DB55
MTLAVVPVEITMPVERARRDVGAQRFLGLRRFAEVSGVPYAKLQKWRIRGPVWVPPPVVVIGRWAGWALPTIQAWTPDYSVGTPVPPQLRWPHPTIQAADTITMCRLHNVATAGLWLRISRQEIARPDIWVDDRPGWISHDHDKRGAQ